MVMTEEENILLNKAMIHWYKLTDEERFDVIVKDYRKWCLKNDKK